MALWGKGSLKLSIHQFLPTSMWCFGKQTVRVPERHCMPTPIRVWGMRKGPWRRNALWALHSLPVWNGIHDTGTSWRSAGVSTAIAVDSILHRQGTHCIAAISTPKSDHDNSFVAQIRCKCSVEQARYGYCECRLHLLLQGVFLGPPSTIRWSSLNY